MGGPIIQVKVDGKPLTKLIEVVAAGIGALYQPRHIRLTAAAESEALEVKARALSEVRRILGGESDAYDDNNFASSPAKISLEDVKGRISARIQYRERSRQENIENIAKQSAQYLPNETTNDPVNEDWIARFFLTVQDISDVDLQKIWAKILAGEVSRPGLVSLRTIEIVKNISREEAAIFEKYATLFTETLLFDFDSEMQLYDIISYNNIIILNDCGLLNDTSVYTKLSNQVKEKFEGHLLCDNLVILVRGSDPLSDVKLCGYKLTEAGRELRSVLGIKSDPMHVERIAKHLAARSPLAFLEGRRRIEGQIVLLGRLGERRGNLIDIIDERIVDNTV